MEGERAGLDEPFARAVARVREEHDLVAVHVVMRIGRGDVARVPASEEVAPRAYLAQRQ